MYKRVKIKKLGRKKTHREALMSNQLRSLFKSGKVRTTSPKANVLKSNAERLMAKSLENLSSRRKVSETLGTKELFDIFANYVKKEKKGVKIVKVGFRPGDMSEVSRVELINFREKKVKKEAVKGKEQTKKVEKKESRKENVNILERLGRGNAKVEAPKEVRVNTEKAKSRSGL